MAGRAYVEWLYKPDITGSEVQAFLREVHVVLHELERERDPHQREVAELVPALQVGETITSAVMRA